MAAERGNYRAAHFASQLQEDDLKVELAEVTSRLDAERLSARQLQDQA